VELSSFTAVALHNKVTINWVTESELNNLGFIVMKGDVANGPFVELDSYRSNPYLLGAGNSSVRLEYTFIDEEVQNHSIYWYLLIDVDFNGVRQNHGPLMVKTNFDNVSRDFVLHQNYPNPFNPSTTIQFSLPRPGKVELAIYTLSGQRIAIVMSDYLKAETHEVIWNGRDNFGNPVSSGVYLYELKSGMQRISKKMMLLK
jgi:hypothetical protein